MRSRRGWFAGNMKAPNAPHSDGPGTQLCNKRPRQTSRPGTSHACMRNDPKAQRYLDKRMRYLTSVLARAGKLPKKHARTTTPLKTIRENNCTVSPLVLCSRRFICSISYQTKAKREPSEVHRSTLSVEKVPQRHVQRLLVRLLHAPCRSYDQRSSSHGIDFRR